MSVSKIPVDVVGRTVSWRPTESSARLQGEVVRVGFQWPYPKDEKGMRVLRKQMSVLLPDERIININCEQEDIHRLNIEAVDQGELAW